MSHLGFDFTVYRCGDLGVTQEKLSKYKPGGYHPVSLGDSFKGGRYTIHHKLGWGGFSTVWLARDRDRKEWVSVKILTAATTIPSSESSILKNLSHHTTAGLHGEYIVQLLDEVIHHGPNGSHQCLVFELLGPSLRQIIQEYSERGDKPEPEVVIKTSKQLLRAISFIHHTGFAHGDLNATNIAFTASQLSKSSNSYLFEVLGDPKTEELSRFDGKSLEKSLPRQLVKAFSQGQAPKILAQPGDLQVPETFFANNFSSQVDLWRAGMIIFTAVTGALPFSHNGNVAQLIHQMAGFSERLPIEWHQKYKSIRSSAECKFDALQENGSFQLDRRFQEHVKDPALQALRPVIKALARFRPSDRISASTALGMINSIPLPG